MKHLLDDVAAFHKACDVPISDKPQILSQQRQDLRLDLIEEELTELKRGFFDKDIPQIADALADMIYVIVGTALESGIRLDRVWTEVQRSNMAKIDPVTGKARKRADGKILKPEGWCGPDIKGVLGLK